MSVPCRLAATALLVVLLALPSALFAETLTVPGDHGTIQEAIDEASDGDVIEVEADLYIENLDFLGKELSLIACDGPEDTIINGSELTLGADAGSVIYVSGGTAETVLIEGFTINGGIGTSFTNSLGNALRLGGGIYLDGAGATIRDCVLEENDEGAVKVRDGCLVIEDCVVRENTKRGGVDISPDSSATIVGCTFVDNEGELSSAGAVTIDRGCDVTIADTDFIDNSGLFCGAIIQSGRLEANRCRWDGNTGLGGAIFLASTDDGIDCEIFDSTFEGNEGTGGGGVALVSGSSGARFVRCLMVGNEADRGGAFFGESSTTIFLEQCTLVENTSRDTGAIRVRSVPGRADTEFELVNCIVWDNGDDPFDESDGEIRVTYSNVEGSWDGTGNIDEDPEFSKKGDYRLTEDSPCIDAGDPDFLDPDGTTADMGAFYFRQAPIFLRGDADGDLVTSALLDALFLLEWAFAGGDEPLCMDAADVDNGGSVAGIVDSIALLGWGFTGGDEPPDPGPYSCGFDPDGDDDDLTCDEEPDCR